MRRPSYAPQGSRQAQSVRMQPLIWTAQFSPLASADVGTSVRDGLRHKLQTRLLVVFA